MPRLAVVMVRTSLICMGIGFLFGSLILHHKGIPIYPWTWSLLTPHIEFMIFGWTLQLVMGTGFWILPRFPNIARYPDRYGNTGRVWIVYVLYNLGIVMSAWAGFTVNLLWQAMGRGAMLAAVILYISVMWPRIRAFSDMVAQSNYAGTLSADEGALSSDTFSGFQGGASK